jgi:hypothetical protein
LGLNLYIILNMHFILMCPDFVILLCTSNARQFYSSKGECWHSCQQWVKELKQIA